jgi:putative hydrolase of the HAD superfamily
MQNFDRDPTQLQAVLFDAVGTLLFADPPVVDIYAEVGRQCGSKASRVEIGARFKAALTVQDELDRRVHAQRTDEAREKDRWRAIVAAVLGDAADPHAALALLWEHFARPASWRLADDAAEVFDELERRSLAWGLASNFDIRLDRICRGQPPLARCRHVFVSSQLGWRKPSPNFFRAIEQRLGCPPQALLLVGDDRENDYVAARSAGWQAVLLSAAAEHADETRVSCLRDLIGLLDRA